MYKGWVCTGGLVVEFPLVACYGWLMCDGYGDLLFRVKFVLDTCASCFG